MFFWTKRSPITFAQSPFRSASQDSQTSCFGRGDETSSKCMFITYQARFPSDGGDWNRDTATRLPRDTEKLHMLCYRSSSLPQIHL